MTTSPLVKYAVWFSSDKLSEENIADIFSTLWHETWEHWNLPPIEGMEDESADSEFLAELDRDSKRLTDWSQSTWVQLGHMFYLLLTESHLSPGDICGWIRHKNLIGAQDEVVVIPIATDSYIPWQGLLDKQISQKIGNWQKIHEVVLISRPTK